MSGFCILLLHPQTCSSSLRLSETFSKRAVKSCFEKGIDLWGKRSRANSCSFDIPSKHLPDGLVTSSLFVNSFHFWVKPIKKPWHEDDPSWFDLLIIEKKLMDRPLSITYLSSYCSHNPIDASLKNMSDW